MFKQWQTYTQAGLIHPKLVITVETCTHTETFSKLLPQTANHILVYIPSQVLSPHDTQTHFSYSTTNWKATWFFIPNWVKEVEK